jgi:3-dehydroquinate dehydratase/shikimate dehydrogenase
VGPLERRLSLRNAKVLVLGAGGAARAAVFGCRDRGAEVWILNRTPETAQKLARQAGAKSMRRDQMTKQSFDVIINATPAGMSGNKTATLLTPEEMNARLVFDLVYNPIDTPLLRMARQKGLAVISGVEMFVQQGARQFEIWTGKPAPEEEMLRVVLHSLRQSAESPGGDGSVLTAPTRIETSAQKAAAHVEANAAKAPAKAPAHVAAKAVVNMAPPAKKAVSAPAARPAVKPVAHGKAAAKSNGNGKATAAKSNGARSGGAKPNGAKPNGAKPNGKAKTPAAKAAPVRKPATKAAAAKKAAAVKKAANHKAKPANKRKR